MAKQQTASRQKARPKDTGSAKRKSGSGGEASSYEQELTELLQERIKPNLNRGSIPLLARSLAKDIAARQRSDEAEGDEESRDDEAGADEERDAEAQAGDEPEAEVDEDEATDDEDQEPEAEAGDEEPEEDEAPDDEDQEPEADAEADEEDEDDDEASEDEDEDEPAGDGEDPVSVFEEEMHQLQEDLGDDWIVRFSVQNDEAWLTAEKEDGTQHVEGPTADVLREAVELLEGGGKGDED